MSVKDWNRDGKGVYRYYPEGKSHTRNWRLSINFRKLTVWSNIHHFKFVCDLREYMVNPFTPTEEELILLTLEKT